MFSADLEKNLICDQNRNIREQQIEANKGRSNIREKKRQKRK